jgi:elongation factor 4
MLVQTRVFGRHTWSSNLSIGSSYFESRKFSTDEVSLPADGKIVSMLKNQDILDRIPLEDVRNFCFIAHVDHGKSSLSARLLEITGNMGDGAQTIALAAARGEEIDAATVQEGDREQIEMLDTLSVERERGITVKATTASMLYAHPSAVGPEGVLLLNMIDTPGHADFGREVARSLSFVQGAVLLLDATQGIQAQTWTVHEKAKSMEVPPELILAMTKIDLDVARPIHVALTVSEWLSLDDPEDIIPTSARSRIGIARLLDVICRRVPPPSPLEDDADGTILRAQVVDSWYDSRGVNCLVQIMSGSLKEGDRIAIANGEEATRGQAFSVQEVGIVLPRSHRTEILRRGQMGYVRFGLRDPRQADPGTMIIFNKDLGKDIHIPLKDITSSKSVLYASVHPDDEDGFEELCEAVERLALNDKGLEVARTADHGSTGSEIGGPFLGPGLRVGFQGLLHVEVFRQRLLDEFGIEALVTPPKVPYQITFLPSKNNNLEEPVTKVIEDLAEWPGFGIKYSVKEPMVEVRIMAPATYTGAVMELITRKRGADLESSPIDEDTWVFEARMPWAEVVVNFHDMLKNVTAGYGSLDTSEADPPLQEASLSKVDILLNNDEVGPLSFVCHRSNAQAEARVVCQKLQEVLPRQQFVVVIQARADGKIIASERIRAYRKDVLVKSGKVVGGGDTSRKKKLLEAQKRGKKRQQHSGRVTLSQAAFNSVISRSS